ncbi:hypothetical protein PanWU01x14_065730 [Parasponia andersonii]|uniref:Uncharacterized protein n=1 Tax=Parasponia andersonii TaxID=3476 RepID=A0A2P5DGW0_PARAD|nr:hypothetical protein PanWU01x14_065730 [Parasponia andersonii]
MQTVSLRKYFQRVDTNIGCVDTNIGSWLLYCQSFQHFQLHHWADFFYRKLLCLRFITSAYDLLIAEKTKMYAWFHGKGKMFQVNHSRLLKLLQQYGYKASICNSRLPFQ